MSSTTAQEFEGEVIIEAMDGDEVDPSQGRVEIDLTNEPDAAPPPKGTVRKWSDPTYESFLFPNTTAYFTI